MAFSPSYESFLAVTQALLQPCRWHFCSSYLQGISDEFKGEMWTEKWILSWLMKLWELKWMWGLWRKNFHWPYIKKSRLCRFACVDAMENWWWQSLLKNSSDLVQSICEHTVSQQLNQCSYALFMTSKFVNIGSLLWNSFREERQAGISFLLFHWQK